MAPSNSKRSRRTRKLAEPNFGVRRRVLLGVMLVGLAALVWRAVDQQILENAFLQDEGKRRYLRVVEVPAHRGIIRDRNGEPLAVSAPVDAVWANPRELAPRIEQLQPLAKPLDMNIGSLRRKLAANSGREFVYLKRWVNPERAQAVMAAAKEREITGLGLLREYRRYYPSGEITAHLVGFTDIDDRGQEGLELVYDDWLMGRSGAKRVIKDGQGRVVANVERVRAPQPGRGIDLSVDRRVQFLAYRELKRALKQHKARAGSAVMLDVLSGEVLAMVNQPAYNPNGGRDNQGGRLRNRAVTDVLEPGSTVKPFVIALAMERGLVGPGTQIETAPGWMRVGRNIVKDVRNFGLVDVSTVITKSSNVGITKVALQLEPQALWQLYRALGMGQVTESGFPGEVAGQLPHFSGWSRFEQATLGFGYGLSVTTLQLARAYAVLAADGMKRPVSLLKLDKRPAGERVLSVATSRAVRAMLETVVSAEGTAVEAAVSGYRVAGKTGTAKKSIAGGYAKKKYQSVFAGMAPASKPRLVMVVMVDEPSNGEYYGGKVAAPVFSKVMAGALRLLNVAPDRMEELSVRLADAGGAQ
jgi:cell division protein FtsI (penicillin-binding protein 3)